MLAESFAGVVFGVAAGSEVAAQSHGDGAGGDLRQAGDHHDVAGGDGAGESGGQREGNGESIGHADDHVANLLAAGEMLFYACVLMHECESKLIILQDWFWPRTRNENHRGHRGR